MRSSCCGDGEERSTTKDFSYVTNKAYLNASLLPTVSKRGSYKMEIEKAKFTFSPTLVRWFYKRSELKFYKFSWDEEPRNRAFAGAS